MEQKNKPVRPFSLEYEDAKKKIVNAINEATQTHGVPFYMLEEILANIAAQVRENANHERQTAALTYGQKMAEWEAKEGGGGDGL